jgi:hypothetical protein
MWNMSGYEIQKLCTKEIAPLLKSRQMEKDIAELKAAIGRTHP